MSWRASNVVKNHWQNADGHAQLLLQAMPVACGLMTPQYELVEFNRAAIELFALQEGKPFRYENPEDGSVSECHGRCNSCVYKKNQHDCIVHKCLVKNWRHTIPGYLENPEKWATTRTVFYQKAIEEGSYTLSMDRVTLYGEELHCEITIVPIKYKDEYGFALYLRDMRETRLRELAQEESRIKTQFLARMSHEIRTPMNAVLGITEIQLQKDSHPPDTQEAFLRIRNSSNMLLGIINEILDISKIEAGKMEIIPVPYDVTDLIIDPVQLNLMLIGEKHIDFNLVVDENLSASMMGDELRIKQVLNNFLSNAIKYTEEGQITLSIGSDRIPNSENVMLIISVRDTGQGMTKEQLDSLFDRFTRFNIQHNRAVEGSGLGMNIAYNLVNLMSGNIEVDSKPGEGSTFTMYIPQKPCGQEILGKQAAEKLQNIEEVKNSFKKLTQIERIAMPYGRVLVVDDVETNLFVAKGMLEPYRLSIETAGSGFEAISLIKSGKEYDIIFMDHMMPEMDGIEAARSIKDLGYKHPIIALTANIVMGQSEIFMNAGFAGYIPKPIDANIMNEYLKRFIRDKQSPEFLLAFAESYVTSPRTTHESDDNLSDALVESFLRDAKKSMDTLSNALANLDDSSIKLYTINAHAMKSALANIGETNMSDFAYTLEQLSLENDIERIKIITPLFLNRLAEIAKHLTPEELPEDNEDEDPDFLHKQLKIIHDSCESYNKKAARAALEALSQKTWSRKTNDTLMQIRVFLLHSDFEAAAEVIQIYL